MVNRLRQFDKAISLTFPQIRTWHRPHRGTSGQSPFRRSLKNDYNPRTYHRQYAQNSFRSPTVSVLCNGRYYCLRRGLAIRYEEKFYDLLQLHTLTSLGAAVRTTPLKVATIETKERLRLSCDYCNQLLTRQLETVYRFEHSGNLEDSEKGKTALYCRSH